LWTAAEMDKVLEEGYKDYDVWHFEQSNADLWKGNIEKFIEIELETSEFTCSETRELAES
jgi:hypothetical protein